LTSESFINTQAKSPTGIQTSSINAFTYQVTPNPFRNEIQITYTVPEKALVTIALYTSGGSELTTLVSQQAQSGSQTVSKDVSQYAKFPGVYLLKLTVGDKTYTEKLLKY